MTLEQTLQDFIVTTKERFLDSDRKFEVTKKMLSKRFRETERIFKETDKKFQETKQLLSESSLETDRMFKETDKKFQDTDKKFQDTDKMMKNLMKKSSEFDSNWGKLVEAMVEPAVLGLFKDRGIDVSVVTNNIVIEKDGKQVFEMDMLLRNGDSVVLVEVKTTLRHNDVNEHIEKRLKRFKEFFPEYNDKKIYGAVAYIKCKENADLYATRKGLFVLTFSGKNLIVIKNDKDYQPRDFRTD